MSAFVDKRDGRCILEHRVEGKVYRERGDSWTEVEYLRDVRLAELGRISMLADDGTTTLLEAFADWLKYDAPTSARNGQPIAPGTMRNHRNAYRELEASSLASIRLIDLRVRYVEAWFATLASRSIDSLGYTMLAEMRARLIRVVDRAVRLELVETNVVERTKVPATARRRGKAQWLDRDGFARLREELGRVDASNYERALLVTLLAGCRPGEALGLRWTAVDFDAGTLAVRSGLQVAENGRTREVVDELKTTSSRRVLEMPTDLARALRFERTRQAEERLASTSWADPTLVFATSTGRPLNPSNMRRTMAGLVARLDLADVTPNELRHSFASMMLDLGLAMPAVARAMGHTDTRMVAARYGHALDDIVPTAAALNAMVANVVS